MKNGYVCCVNLQVNFHENSRKILINLGRIQPFMKLPLAVVQITIALIGPIMNIGKSRVFMYHKNTVERMGEDRHFSNKKAKTELGFQPKYSIEDGLTHTVQWNFDHGGLVKQSISIVGWIVIALFLCFFVYFVV